MRWIETSGTGQADGPAGIFLAPPAEAEQALTAAAITPDDIHIDDIGPATRYEYHDDYDFFALFVPRVEGGPGRTTGLQAYYNGCALVVLCDEPLLLQTMSQKLDEWKPENRRPDKAAHLLFSLILAGDAARLEQLEGRITTMEEQVVQPRPKEYTGEIIRLRKQLLVLKRYYGAMFDLLEDLEENQNGYWSKPMLRDFRLHTNRADRLVNSVNSLRDYLSQVRDAYQNQIDINLNQIMKIFTVITTIFLPLTVIAGWYGMNLQMPEYEQPYAYPVVIAISAAVVGVILWYFKKRRWF